MLFQRVNRTDPEKIFIVAYNSYSTAALTNGQAVIWDYLNDQDGVSVTKPENTSTDAGFAFAGVASETIAIGAYGLIQVYGYHSATLVRRGSGSSSNVLGTISVVPGTPLHLSPQESTAAKAATQFVLEGMSMDGTDFLTFHAGFSLHTSSFFTAVAGAIFIKAL